ncbi:DUF6086 family protein [Streptomyces sp. NPDC026672]|uniref:DUF6086 family protein n=1 Tax=unclassified Streptomyces TaxID=2593676 RepID=UPI0033EF93C5
MSYPFERNGETLWDAGYSSGQMYAALAGGAAEFLRLPSGLTDTPQGSCEVDPVAFRAFVAQLYKLYASTGNDVLQGLTHDLLVTSLVLLDRAGEGITLDPEHETALQAQKARLARCMA